MSSSIPPFRPHTPWPRIAQLSVLLAVVVSVLVVAFLWPTVTSSVHGIPVALVGDSATVSQVESQLEARSPDTFDFRIAGSVDAAEQLIRERAAYGAIVVGTAPQLLTSSAASPVVNSLLTGLSPALGSAFTEAAIAQGAPASTVVTVPVTDVVPLSSSDPRGTAFAASSFPLVLGGMLGGILTSLLVVGVWRRVTLVFTYAVIGGVALTSILQFWFGALQGNFALNAAAVALTIAAISGVITGAVALLGRAGVLVGPVLFLLIANPLSAATGPVEFLAQPWGAVGQLLPPGAAATLLRDLSYFPDATTLTSWLALGGWTLLGLLLSTAGHFRSAGAVTQTALVEAEVAELEHEAQVAGQPA